MKQLFILVAFTISSSAIAETYNLFQLVELATKNSSLVKASNAEVRSARSEVEYERSKYLPQLKFNADYRSSDLEIEEDSNRFSTTDTLSSFTVSAEQAIYDKTKIESLSKAKKQHLLTKAHQNSIQQQLILDVVAGYLNLLRSKDNLSFTVKQYDAVSKQLTKTKKRLEVGIATDNELLEVESNLGSAEAELIFARNQLDISARELSFITGIEVNQIEPLSADSVRLSAFDENSSKYIDAALRNNPEIIIGRLSAEIKKHDVLLSSSARYPKLSLIAEYSKEDEQQLNVITNNQGFVGLNLSVPLYLGGGFRKKRSSLNQDYKQASYLLEHKTEEVRKNVEVTISKLDSLISRKAAMSRLQQSAVKALEATETGYRLGTRTVLDVLDATSNLYDVKAQSAGVNYDIILNLVSLDYLNGRLSIKSLKNLVR